MLVVPGSTGLAAMEPMAALLASHGYLALVAAYMQEPGLPPAMKEIPVEVIGAALSQVETRAGPSALISASVGTQGTLSALALGVAAATRAVAIAPSSVVWQALPDNGRPPQTAAWSHGGEPLPRLAMHGERILPEMVKQSLLDRVSRHPLRRFSLAVREPPGAGAGVSLRQQPGAGTCRSCHSCRGAVTPARQGRAAAAWLGAVLPWCRTTTSRQDSGTDTALRKRHKANNTTACRLVACFSARRARQPVTRAAQGRP